MTPITRPVTFLEQFHRAIAPPRRFLNPDTSISDVFYHYTTAGGFGGILSDKPHLRATNFSFLNDPSEVQYGRDLVERTLVKRLDTDIPRHRAFFEFVISGFDAEMAAEVYVACFTELEDDLSQWRAYGTSTAERYAMGFDSEALYSLAWSTSGASAHRIEYEVADQQATIDGILDRSLAFLDTHRVPPSRIAPLADAATKRLALIMPTLKAPSYKCEKEWRLVIWSTAAGSHPEFDTTRGVVRPYMSFHLGEQLPIVSLHVMAPARREIALKAAGMLLRKAGLTFQPQHSTIPFAD